jgi:hypothetical protein
MSGPRALIGLRHEPHRTPLKFEEPVMGPEVPWFPVDTVDFGADEGSEDRRDHD